MAFPYSSIDKNFLISLLKLSCYQLKIGIINIFCVSLMVTTKEKSVVDIQKIIIKESKNNTTKSHQIAKEGSKKGKKEQRIYKTVRKQLTK